MPAGLMRGGNGGGNKVGSGSDAWKYWADLRAGNIDQAAWREIEEGIARGPGHCMTMGTASTMGAIAETLGLTLPGASSIPAADSGHARMASQTGRRIVEMVWDDRKPSDILSAASFDNAVAQAMADGKSVG